MERVYNISSSLVVLPCKASGFIFRELTGKAVVILTTLEYQLFLSRSNVDSIFAVFIHFEANHLHL